MIISHAHRFIFIHCRKVAGSSIKVSLAPHLGRDDLVIGSYSEIREQGIDLPVATEEILKTPFSRLAVLGCQLSGRSAARSQNIAIKLHFHRQLGIGREMQMEHPTAEVAAKLAGPVWDTYTKFCFVRNPYERAVSDYLWRRRMTKIEVTFLKYLEALLNGYKAGGVVHRSAVSNWDMISMNGKIIVDHIGRYERLHEDFGMIMKKLGLEQVQLDVWKKKNPLESSYGDYYGKKERELVEKLFCEEIEQFGYDFPYNHSF